MNKFLKLSYKKFFLIDGFGALVTTMMLFFVLASFQSYFGMPLNVLYWLASAAACFALYSFGCYFFLKGNWKPFLSAIAVANAAYCIVTLILIFKLRDDLTILGITYFMGEILLVMALVRLEWMKANERNNQNLD